MILNFTNAVFDQSGSTFDNTNTLLFNAALFVSVPLVIYDVVSNFTDANNISSSTNFGKDHMFFAISLYNFGFYPPCTLHIVFHFGNIFRYCCSSPRPSSEFSYHSYILRKHQHSSDFLDDRVPNQLCCVILLFWNIVADSRTYDGNLCDKLHQQQATLHTEPYMLRLLVPRHPSLRRTLPTQRKQ